MSYRSQALHVTMGGMVFAVLEAILAVVGGLSVLLAGAFTAVVCVDLKSGQWRDE